ncbi:oligosaccharide flippase family protein [Acidisoma cellulosilytica]|uniref:Oligosaccharide flippase family protein n=1 Tax=Acidisoma cellulosilyticum TaxID=2802395 RepID=A0A963Z1N3_9PROT|nr:oligosaccharide flippase family protein [Acidisoma cellulosilyticum]MCB8881059.1 oligosaccharide flippase family protein [Acidisoma cellulosilyticum]
MDSHQQHLARGFNWLGGATILAKLVDFSTIIVVLLCLTKQQVGIGSLVVSFAMILEALNGLGTSDALVQASLVSRLQLDSLFWFILGSAVLVGAVTFLLAPLVAALCDNPSIIAYLGLVALKQPIVAMAVIPLALLNRGLRYDRIAIVGVSATLGGALTRLALAFWGAGSWVLVVGYTASGFYVLLGALVARPFVPRFRFDYAAIRPLLSFGLRAASSNLSEQVFKNVDYLLVGWFYGAAPLASYRLAFDAAMEPATAISTVIRRTALPVFARTAAEPGELAVALTWAVQRLLRLAAPLMMVLVLIARPLTGLIHDEHGHSYASSALPMQLLAVAALLRVTTELLFPVLLAAGRPGIAARLSVGILLTLTLAIFLVGYLLPQGPGIIAVAGCWLAIYPFVLVWGARMLHRDLRFPLRALARVLVETAASLGVTLALVVLAEALAGNPASWVQIVIVLLATALVQGGLYLRGRQRIKLA